MKKTFFTFLLILIFLLSTSFAVFATVVIDGSIKPAEFGDTNMEVQCDGGNSGNDLYILVTCYKPLPNSSQIYLAFNSELKGEEILADGPFGFEIYIENAPVIRIYANNHADFDPSYFSIENDSIIAFSGIKCETLIIFKNRMPDTPEIYVKVIDNEGIPSKRFKINTIMPEPTTEEPTKPREETTKKNSNSKPSFDFSLPFSLDDITLKTTKPASQNTEETNKNNSSTQTEQKGTKPNDTSEKSTKRHKPSKSQSNSSGIKHNNQDSTLNSDSIYKNDELAVQYDLANETSDKNIGTNKKRNMLVAVSACALAATIVGSALIGVKIKGKK